MPTYDFVCHSCDTDWEIYLPFEDADIEQRCPDCRGGLVRMFSSPHFVRGMQPHYNYQLGKYVENQREANDELKKISERQTARTGIPHDYKWQDPDANKGTGDIEKYKGYLTDTGKREPKKFY